jgi:hypothetical protein
MMSAMLKFISLVCLFVVSVYGGGDSFNYEVGPRVSENIQYLLQEVALATSMPTYQFQSLLLNISDFTPTSVFLPGSQMFFVLKQLYMTKLNTMNFGLENGFYYCMINNAGFPLGIELDISDPDLSTNMVNVYHVLPNGLPDMSYRDCTADPNICAFPFHVTGRPWYRQGAKSTSTSWTKPFLQTFPTVPTIAISYPLYSNGVFRGVASANVLLDQISGFLEKSYQNTDRNVFVVDKATGYLIGSSMGVALYTGTSSAGNLVRWCLSNSYEVMLMLFRLFFLRKW